MLSLSISAAITRYHKWGSLNSKYFSQFEGWKSKIMVKALFWGIDVSLYSHMGPGEL